MAEENDFDMQPVTSSQIAEVGYDAEAKKLRVLFNHKGSLYEYSGVEQETFDALVGAASVGIYFNENVKSRYPFVRIS